ncbi:hypothetical protein RH915_01515 [Serpentinicella sp. ANB-PHB4]|uniref:hypothetical protein n=1 Tax=Serpentinicella sp. ANB-PHB4 TaxID=3074076 RepID=UPI0028603F72|nr:hypothetical protein [Serpentinicella sp. ANB-PHB4]MDR5658158.1 hypothetical protein [Serpentinicella sp. ANB-PHB4]
MDIKEAIELIWNNRKYSTNDPKTAISHLNEEVAESLKALMNDDIAKAKRELKDAMSCMFIALKVLNVDVEEAIAYQVEQMKTQQNSNKIMRIYKNKVEIVVNNHIKGSWSIWSEDDLEEARKIGKEFGCKIKYITDDNEISL